MSSPHNLICPYCQTANPPEQGHCLACGAPLPAQAAPQPPHPKPISPGQRAPAIQPGQEGPAEQIRKVTEKTDDLYFTVLNTYAIAWRTLAEAVSIALVAFVLGLIGGATSLHFFGILAGGLVGLCVGWARKNFYLTLAGAPLGLLLGLAVGAILWATGNNPQWLLLCATLPAMVAALLGNRPQGAYRRRNWWEKARPFLGLLGALAFAIPGMLLGWALSAALQAL
ncbi:MAG: zinc ribbon domain-containing protein [Anaerolineales bacterium]|nr:zinc ribbon domain-containing protein [Anaerolineales bacterium]